MQLFDNHEKKHFTFMHCHNKLKHHPKWDSIFSSKKLKTSKHGTSASSPAGPTFIDIDVETGNLNEDGSTRPMGCKAAKAARRRSSSSSSTWNESSMKASYDSLNKHMIARESRREAYLREQDSKQTAQHNETLSMERRKMEFIKELEERKLEQAEKLKLMELEQAEKLKQMELDQAEKEKRVEIEQVERDKQMERDRQHENFIMNLDMSKLDSVSYEYYAILKKKLLDKARGQQ